MIESGLTLDINPFGAMLAEAATMLDQFAAHAAMAGDRVSRGLFGAGVSAQVTQGANIAAGSIQKAGRAAQVTASQVASSGQKAAHAAGGYQAHANAATQAGHASAGFATKVGHTLHTLAKAGHTLAGIVHGVGAVNTVFKYFKGAHQPVQQTATAMHAVATQTSNAQAPARRWTSIIVMAGTAAAGAAASVWLLNKAYRALNSQRPPQHLTAAPPRPMGGGGLSAILGAPAAMVSALIPGLGQMVAGALAGIGLGALVGKAIGAAAARQKAELQLGIVLNDSDQAKTVIDDLKKRSDRTEHDEETYLRQGRALLGMGVAATEVGQTLDRLGNIAAGSDAALSDLVSQYGRWKSKGQITREELDQLAADGVPLLQQLASQMGVNIATIQQLGSDGAISFDQVNSAIEALTGNGGRLEGMMTKNATTITGIWDALKSKITSVLADFGTPINNALKAAAGAGNGFLAQALEAVEVLRARATEFGVQVARGMKVALAAFQELGAGGVVELLQNSLMLAFKLAVNQLHAGLAGAAAAFGAVLATVVQIALSVFEKGDFTGVLMAKMDAFTEGLVASAKEFIATLLEGMAKVPGFGGSSGEMAKEYRGDAATLRAKAAEHLKSKLATFVPDGASLMQALKDGASEVTKAFRTGFDAAGAIMDASGEQRAVSEALDKISGRALQNLANSLAQEEKDKQKGGVGTAPDAKVTVDRTPGYFASAINLLAGRSVGELALDESKRQTALLQQVVKNTTPKTHHANPVQATAIDNTPRFF